MDFRVTEDQQALQEGVRSFCENRVSLERIAERAAAAGRLDRGLWAELAEMGVFGLRLPEEAGGVGLGTADAALVFEELGRRLVPGPLVWTHLAAGHVKGAAEGTAVVGGLDLRGGTGGPLLVEHLADLDVLLVLEADGVRSLDPKSLEATPVETPLDPLTPLHRVAALPEGDRLGDADLAERLWHEGGALSSALLLGIAQETTRLAVAYAKGREQFGRPIGSFQALKHIMADMFVRQEVARAAVYAAGVTLDDPAVGDAARAVASAKISAGEAAMKNSRACVQVYGGMGYTWEMPPHYYLKRTWVLDKGFGEGEEHAERVAEQVAAAL